jgi:paraquat-inducible protein B
MNQRSHPKDTDSLPSASIHQGHLTRWLWIVPIAAAALCGWFLYRDYVATGPMITIYFHNADGLQEKNTQVKYRGAQVGQVRVIQLQKDNEYVKVQARLTGAAKNLAREGSLFWIVRPEVKVGAISGLGTIVSGEYIAVQPGKGEATNSFTGVDKEPLPEQVGSLQVVLTSPSLGSLQEMSPVFYRGIQVGEVLYFQLNSQASNVTIHARIHKEYAPLVRADSKFWNAGGLNVHAGLFRGIDITAESPKTIVSGGVEFATPLAYQAEATNDTVYELYDKPEDKWKTWAPAIKLELPAEANQSNTPPKLRLK